MGVVDLIARASTAGDCTKDTCPAEMSIYGYAPSWDFNLFFTINFAITAIVFYHQTILWPKWRVYSAACAIGCLMEAGGYVGRLMLHKDPFSDFGFKLNVVFLTVAPAFISAGIYLTLKRATIIFGQRLSRFPPSWYVYGFIGVDTISIILQGAGGAISAIAEKKQLLDQGVDIMIAGLAFQVFTLLVFFLLTMEYVLRCWANSHLLNPGTIKLAKSAKFQMFVTAISVAFLCIFARCCYRVGELSHGWGSELMRKEDDFIVLDSDMCTLAALLLCIFHPQIFFKEPEREQVSDHGAHLRSKSRQKVTFAVREQEMTHKIQTPMRSGWKDNVCMNCGQPPYGNWV